MKNKKLSQLCENIREDCLELMRNKDVDIDEISFQLGVSLESFIEAFQKVTFDVTFYMQTYHLLQEW